ncbi:helix-turn-helix transcriptional regulator [Clostridium sp.]|uniref:helix-turn-helix domain-containing protein n=1 Tax=Clostridium sp. TaxID=1506 RepID=UPI0028FE83DA|nr:helix-turn-helix transcriptional regulator [Clostridium sp.]MDU5443046.1 helix-turn-helix transcriptional regulator [Finegoldia magna]MDU2108605.1 helix-turn-helix transcriptional regulator [Clostridium sp.]MDU2756835.1 helix-turn-helix transcriptional regulator [Clostridium sp.]MDU2902404.1 helix-turn-helix transcriptional regulator [Clostridium sp.]MDU3354819.1 helix-turn-helix transcriptional regulator [Clostridium sp.]
MKPYEKLKSIRIEKGLTTYELSELTGIPQSTISKMENGKRKIETDSIQALAKAFNVPISDFFDEKNISTNINNTDTNDEFDEETRAIARDMKNLSSSKKQLLKELIKSMSTAGDEELKK